MKIKKIFIRIWTLSIVITSCKSDCIQYGNKNDKQTFVHGRAGYGVNGYFTYEYYLVITNYQNNTMTIRDFVKIANEFLDTIHVDRPIEDIIFLGQPPNGCTPRINQDINKIEKSGILTLRFEQTNKEIKENLKKIVAANFWRNGKQLSEIKFDKQYLQDSILNSAKLISNE